MPGPCTRAARLRQAILLRVDTHLRAWLYGDDRHATKLFREVDELINEFAEEIKNSSSDE